MFITVGFQYLNPLPVLSSQYESLRLIYHDRNRRNTRGAISNSRHDMTAAWVTLLAPDTAGTTDVATGASAVLLTETNPPKGVDDATG